MRDLKIPEESRNIPTNDSLCIILPFSAGVTRASVTVQILPDDLPEEAEELDVYLADPSGDVVIFEPSVATVVIEANDEPNGVVRIKTEQGRQPVFFIDEDETSQYTGILVTRGLGR